MKRRVTITIDEAMYKALHLDKKNVSGYFNTLLEEKFMADNLTPIGTRLTQTVKNALLEDEDFFREITNRVKGDYVQYT